MLNGPAQGGQRGLRPQRRALLRAVRGETLVGLMVGLTIGLLVVAGAGALYTSSTRSLSFALRASRLDQDMQAIMEAMMRDIRRAQYNPAAYQCASTGSCSDPFATGIGAFATYAADGTANASQATQIQYAWDVNGDGILQTGECSGFRLVQTGNVGRVDKITGCPASLGGAATWTALSDPVAVNVTQLVFSVGTSCVAAGTGFLVIRDVLVYLQGTSNGVQRHLCQKVHVHSDVRAAACTAGTLSTTTPFTAANGCPT